ncbi:hypothetical protein REH65_25065 [Saccharopolyspora sp. ID03-671]|uniref:hypothetical protein n=1 Tax=Saccharopolyspora sp. ID03-671 TaxID=3073066 RepID=UPI003243871B
MVNPNRWVRAARAPLARLIAVLTVIAGFALMHAPQCADGMMPAVHLTATADHAMSDMPGMGPVDGPGNHDSSAVMPSAAAGTVYATNGDESMGGSLLMTCLALLVTMLGILVLLRRSLIPLGTRILRRSGTQARPRAPLRPSLIQLCILRT